LFFIVINNGGLVNRGVQKVVIVIFYCYFLPSPNLSLEGDAQGIKAFNSSPFPLRRGTKSFVAFAPWREKEPN